MSSQPNILLIMTDQQRFDSLGCYGFEAAYTPNLDQLAADGVLFEHCYVNNPICTPSRASLMTGKHLPGHGVYKLYDILPSEEVLFPEHLQRSGYQTALLGKLHVSSLHFEAEQRNAHDGFDIYEWCLEGCVRMDSPYHAYRQWLEEVNPEFCQRLMTEGRAVKHHPQELHFTHWAAQRTIDFIENHDGSQPFFCMMSIFDPHNPYEDYPLEMLDLLDASKIPDPLLVDGELDAKPEALRRESQHNYLGDVADLSADELHKMRVGYHASVTFADQEIGRVLAALEAKGIADNTLVIFTSDHGDMLGDHHLLVKGAFFFDANVRVPLLMRWPEGGIAGGRRITSLVQLHDLAATILDVAGMAEAERLQWMPDAASLLPVADGSEESVRDYAVCCYRNSGISTTGYWDPPIHATMFRDETFKLNIFHNSPEPEGELYHMLDDPQELHNLWDQPAYSAVQAQMTRRLADWLSSQERYLGARGGEQLPTPGQKIPNKLH
ncbi:MAG: sulfatase-like hydrolase/transferase [Anaerolineae bacterium]|nr:sulfatase-like hydrolase/transferase [Anaerolineae bacterium]